MNQISLKDSLGLPIAIVLFLLVTLAAWLVYRSANPRTNLQSNLSSARAEMKDLVGGIEGMINSSKPLGPPWDGPTPRLVEIPKSAAQWIRSGDGQPLDPFHKGHCYFFGRLGSGEWFLLSAGPDRRLEISTETLLRLDQLPPSELVRAMGSFQYDPTNGSLSPGDLIRQGARQLPPE